MELDTIHHCEHRKQESGIILLYVADTEMPEKASAQSLARLKESDITIENQREHLFKLEKLNKELNLEKLDLVSKVSFHGFMHYLFLRLTNDNNTGAFPREAQVWSGFTSCDKDTTVEACTALQMEHDTLLAQQTH